MGQDVNQKSHESAIFNIIVLLNSGTPHPLEAHESTRREKENHLQREKVSQKQTTEKTHKTETQI